MRLFRHPSTKPLWRDEFAVRAADEGYVTRRQFSKFLLLTSLGMFAGNCWILVKSWLSRARVYPVRVVARVGDLPVGGVTPFAYPTPEDACLLVRTGPETFVAYSQKCTHLSCAVYYAAEERRLECPCHHGAFSAADGRVLFGPPPRPLPRVVLERRGEELVAVKLAQRMEA